MSIFIILLKHGGIEHPRAECPAAGNKMTRKAVIISVSLILVVGVVIGAVVVSNNRNGHSSSNKSLSTNTKAVEAVCAPTWYKDKCINTIAPVAANASAGPKDFLRAALVATMEEVKIWTERSVAMKNDNHTSADNMALDSCKQFLQLAVRDLHKALAMVDDNELHVIHDEVDEFRNWLAANLAFQDVCHDQIGDPDLKAVLQDGLRNATQLTTNALVLFAELSTILRSLNIPLEVNPKPARRLLNVAEHGYPHWLSHENRRLLVGEPPIPNAVVAQDGSGQFNTIGAALASYPPNFPPNTKFVIYVKAGNYSEPDLVVTQNQNNVLMYGDGPEKTIITGSRSAASKKYDSVDTAPFTVRGSDFVAKDIGFINYADPQGQQALALIVNPVMGQVNVISADGTTTSTNFTHTGLVFQHCKIVAEPDLLAANPPVQTFLGRPWKEYAAAIFMYTDIGGFIDPQGWTTMGNYTENCFFAEYANTGPGNRTDGRVKFGKCVHAYHDDNMLSKFTVAPFIRGDEWLPSSGIPFTLGFNDPAPLTKL
ncbi:hypothetical protein NE237_016181 [Protea cynaroides]|uniref:Pectinesterase inhibitor domain-containing protein n=1 Tax=Protea cynaroides TaxID=273540 RepID=A0A9Q0QRS6_9MAGN|nr:hypothetical protein NE237_016181 [Protea cynaroides]